MQGYWNPYSYQVGRGTGEYGWVGGENDVIAMSLVDSPHKGPVILSLDVFFVVSLNTVKLPVIWDAMALMCHTCNGGLEIELVVAALARMIHNSSALALDLRIFHTNLLEFGQGSNEHIS